MMHGITLELCTGSLRDCSLAERFPIDRIELNSALELDGLTPSLSTLRLARKRTGKKIMCMVRPRPAGFVYYPEEQKTMFADAELFLESGADGIAFGFLNPDHTVDKTLTADMCRLILHKERQAVFHMAFDLTPDPFAACETLIECGVSRVLTRGHAASALEGTPLLAQLNALYGDDIEILPGGGISGENASDVVKQSGSKQIHFAAKTKRQDSGEYLACDERRINAILDNLRKNI